MNKTKSWFNDVFGNVINHYTEPNKNIDENIIEREWNYISLTDNRWLRHMI